MLLTLLAVLIFKVVDLQRDTLRYLSVKDPIAYSAVLTAENNNRLDNTSVTPYPEDSERSAGWVGSEAEYYGTYE